MYNYHKSLDINGVKFYYCFTTTAVTAIKIMLLLVLEELAYIDQSRRRVFIFDEFIHDDEKNSKNYTHVGSRNLNLKEVTGTSTAKETLSLISEVYDPGTV